MPKLRTGMNNVGPCTAIVMLNLWYEGKLDFTLIELRQLIKVISLFLEQLEEAREYREPEKRR